METTEITRTPVQKKSRLVEELLEGSDPSDAKHVLKITEEFIKGFEVLRDCGTETCGPGASFFGSARCILGESLYEEARQLAFKLSKTGFAIITGGGGGVMQAANRGGFEAGGRSIGFNIKLPGGQPLNEYTTDSLIFQHFFTRKVMLAFSSEVYIFFPGGYGTLDELFEILTLVQTAKIKPIPVILVGKEFWTPIVELLENWLYKKYGTIDEKDLKIFHLVDSVDEAYNRITSLVKL